MSRRRARGLSNRDRAVIDLEREWGQAPQVQDYKSEAARTLGLSPSGYALVLSALIDDPAALEYDPETISRLRQVRQMRRPDF
ncbi:DUF3263 domain-containing protein [Austwickia chelonae]|uniref:DUF3263 domain-containing protein n=1 Tax=Austwickia chelonae TaxID=100225 RepID=UPI000E283B22|nr:DUF3263 domain-containing protein [Austwickia chelonae]